MCALGEERLSDLLEGTDLELISTFQSKYIERLKQYYYVGGMPEVVKTFSETKDYLLARTIQKDLLNYYQQDFSKHAPNNIVPRLNMVWDSVPMQLSKENKKFIYGQIREGARAKDFELAIQWLVDCGLVHKVQRITKPGLPLKSYVDFNAFKMYLLDVGLLSAMSELSAILFLRR